MHAATATTNIGNRIKYRALRNLLGEPAWQRLPSAVQQRFAEPTLAVDYVGTFETVRANYFGRCIAWLCQVIGTPVVPRTGHDIPATIHVGPVNRGATWQREYRWPRGDCYRVYSTKVIGADGKLVEELPARLCMPLEVYEEQGVLHFVSEGYYFDLGFRRGGRGPRLRLPTWLSPGTTHVQHEDEAHGWFRFTMTVSHPLFGEVFYQTGRFRAAGGMT